MAMFLRSGWIVAALVDGDEHLNIVVRNTESKYIFAITPIEEGNGVAELFTLRFSTSVIEERRSEQDE